MILSDSLFIQWFSLICLLQLEDIIWSSLICSSSPRGNGVRVAETFFFPTILSLTHTCTYFSISSFYGHMLVHFSFMILDSGYMFLHQCTFSFILLLYAKATVCEVSPHYSLIFKSKLPKGWQKPANSRGLGTLPIANVIPYTEKDWPPQSQGAPYIACHFPHPY